jgi:hypothetical protein
LTCGSGGTSIGVWVQTSIDGGTNRSDVANFHWTTSGSTQPQPVVRHPSVTTQHTPTDGTLIVNTCKDGALPGAQRLLTTIQVWRGKM